MAFSTNSTNSVLSTNLLYIHCIRISTREEKRKDFITFTRFSLGTDFSFCLLNRITAYSAEKYQNNENLNEFTHRRGLRTQIVDSSASMFLWQSDLRRNIKSTKVKDYQRKKFHLQPPMQKSFPNIDLLFQGHSKRAGKTSPYTDIWQTMFYTLI